MSDKNKNASVFKDGRLDALTEKQEVDVRVDYGDERVGYLKLEIRGWILEVGG